MRLTKKAVDAAKYPHGDDSKRRFVLWDDDLAGFGLRVYPSGRKVFVFSYRVAGRKRLTVVGPYGALTVQEARKRARKARVEVSDGTDPKEAARRRRQRGMTLSDLALEHMEELEAKRKPATASAYQGILDNHLLPRLGHLPLAAITEDDVRRLHRRMKSTPYIANRALFLLGKLLAVAERRGLRVGNPAREVKRYPERGRTRYLNAKELEALGEALQRLEGEGIVIDDQLRTIAASAAAAIRLLLFTGARKNEILTLRWEYIDVDRRMAHLPDSKTGAKTLVLPGPAIEILESLPHAEDNPWVIGGRDEGTHLADLKRPWNWVREASGLAGVRLHDLRHTVGSWGASGGTSLLIIGKLLGHRQASTTERYAHLSEDPVADAAESISGAIKAAMDGKKAELVDLEHRRAR